MKKIYLILILLINLIFISSCKLYEDDVETSDYEFFSMDTLVSVRFYDEDNHEKYYNGMKKIFLDIANKTSDYIGGLIYTLNEERKVVYDETLINILEFAEDCIDLTEGYFNPYMGKPKDWKITEDNIQEVIEENKVDPITKDSTPYNRYFGSFTYDDKGRLLYYWVDEYWLRNLSDETLEEKAKSSMEDSYSDKLFYNAFVPMPFPFELGDYVRCVDGLEGEIGRNDNRLIGIVSVSREDYENFLERAKKIYVDFSDAQVTTTFIKKDGDLIHDHISPIFLEKAEIDEEADWFNLAQHTRWMIMGEGALDFFTYAYDDYKEKAKQKNGEA